uniref:Dynein heavy chain hydrolytic ATP-binding dynein motor region domain-containing protein n=1 Tax=Ditylenchus dipsaci TaxID=166011 RepID=A0A915E507_9BILA
MKVDLVGERLSVNSNMAIFITMNPGYSGHRKLIAEVMLFSQGSRLLKPLLRKLCHCSQQLSDQYHYDFGLRALKYVLVSAGNIKRSEIQRISKDQHDKATESQERYS